MDFKAHFKKRRPNHPRDSNPQKQSCWGTLPPFLNSRLFQSELVITMLILAMKMYLLSMYWHVLTKPHIKEVGFYTLSLGV